MQRSGNVTQLTSRLLIFVEHIGAAEWQEPSPANEKGGARQRRDKLVAPFDQRQKARQRVRLASGREVGLRLPRGTLLRGGDKLRATEGTVIDVVAAPELVSTVVSADLEQLARFAYHLGNRHVALEVGAGWVRYLRDHVLDAMVTGLGGSVVHERAPFEPEGGAYGAHRHAHTHDPDGRLDDRGMSAGHRHGPLHGHSHSETHADGHADTHAHPPHTHPPGSTNDDDEPHEH